MGKRFNDIQAGYYMILDKYESNNTQTGEEINKINTEITNEVKKINCLKTAALKTSINKYRFNMKFLSIHIQDSIAMKEESIEKLDFIKHKYDSFLDFIRFYNKNGIQKFLSKTFRIKKYEENIQCFDNEVNKIIKQREKLIEEKRLVVDEARKLSTAMKDLLQYVQKAENDFAINKHSLLKAKLSDGTYDRNKLSNTAWRAYEDYINLISILREVMENNYITWNYQSIKSKDILNKIYSYKEDMDTFRDERRFNSERRLISM